MNKSIFITGTGTDVGKTYISALLAKYFKNNGYNCGYYKPVLSGAICIGNKLIPGDCEFVIKSANLNQEPLKASSYIFEEAVSPHLAAKHKNITIDKTKILEDINSQNTEFLIIEGAGGITCPLSLGPSPYLLSDLIKELNINVVLVADAGLGTINSTLLTVEYAKARNINIVGIILNNYIHNNKMYEDNIQSIEKLCKVPVIGLVVKNGEKIDTRNYNLIQVFEDKI